MRLISLIIVLSLFNSCNIKKEVILHKNGNVKSMRIDKTVMFFKKTKHFIYFDNNKKEHYLKIVGNKKRLREINLLYNKDGRILQKSIKVFKISGFRELKRGTFFVYDEKGMLIKKGEFKASNFYKKSINSITTYKNNKKDVIIQLNSVAEFLNGKASD